MKIEKLFVGGKTSFSNHIEEWAEKLGIEVEVFSFDTSEEILPDGLLLINQNQDIPKEIYEVHSFFDKKNLPTQKIDVNGTLQVAVNSYTIWLNANKCKQVLVLGADELVKNENLNRFLEKIQGNTISSAFQS